MKEKLFFVGIKGLITNSDGNILLLLADVSTHRKNTSPYWDIPGGRIENGDKAGQTLKREIKEETGIAISDDASLLGSCIANHEIPLEDGSVAGLVLMVYRVTIPVDATVMLSEEHSEYAWCSPADAAEKLSHKYPKDFTDLLRA